MLIIEGHTIKPFINKMLLFTMKRLSVLAGVIVLLVFFSALLILSPEMVLLPFFVGVSGCDDAEVVIYNGDYNPVSKEVSLLIKNPGKTNLQLEPFITLGTSVSKHSKMIYLSAGGEGIFTLGDVDMEPDEVTVRDKECGNADLWKF